MPEYRMTFPALRACVCPAVWMVFNPALLQMGPQLAGYVAYQFRSRLTWDGEVPFIR